ncbi:hypothetical protein [Streptomyces sp. NPDC046805]|uniref:hypothetical protein n=1 Tax=Streptomyces sp. NPDC046805 TaxID=3155134 RepID=UPI0033C2B08E
MSENPPEPQPAPVPVQPPPELLEEMAEAATPGPDPDEAPPPADDGLLTVVVDGPVQSALTA